MDEWQSCKPDPSSPQCQPSPVLRLRGICTRKHIQDDRNMNTSVIEAVEVMQNNSHLQPLERAVIQKPHVHSEELEAQGQGYYSAYKLIGSSSPSSGNR